MALAAMEITFGWALLLLPLGLAILIKGANWLVNASVALAERLRINPLVIGLTIVAMGTSSPEIAAAVTAAASGRGNISLGNVYGANIANLALIGGLMAVIRPVRIELRTLRAEIPVMIVVALLLWPALTDGQLGRWEALALVGLFAGLLTVMVLAEIREGRRRPAKAAEVTREIHAEATHPPKRLWASAAMLVLGLAFLAIGAQLAVNSAEVVGTRAGLSQAVIGMTILAIGTTLPEMVTGITAALKGHTDIGVGNLIGSNVFNTLMVTGVAGAVSPFEVEPRLVGANYWAMIAVMALFYPLAISDRKLSRVNGVVLLSAYAAYLAYTLLWPQT